jgi:hypothetical protein
VDDAVGEGREWGFGEPDKAVAAMAVEEGAVDEYDCGDGVEFEQVDQPPHVYYLKASCKQQTSQTLISPN